MRIFPSVPAAIVCGAVGMPLLAYGIRYLERISASEWLLLALVIVTFLMPFLVSTTDLKYVKSKWRTPGFYSMKREDLRLFYIPAWLRMLVWWGSASLSLLLLRTLGPKL